MTNQARYDDDGQRTTDCCGSYSTYCGDGRGADVLCCKNCYEGVPGGQGDGPTGLALAAAGQPAPRDFTVGDFKLDTDKDGTPGTDADLKNVITKGALVYGGSAMMAPVQGLSAADQDNLVAFIRSLKQ